MFKHAIKEFDRPFVHFFKSTIVGLVEAHASYRFSVTCNRDSVLLFRVLNPHAGVYGSLENPVNDFVRLVFKDITWDTISQCCLLLFCIVDPTSTEYEEFKGDSKSGVESLEVNWQQFCEITLALETSASQIGLERQGEWKTGFLV